MGQKKGLEQNWGETHERSEKDTLRGEGSPA